MSERVLSLQGVHNFRDAGGYALSGGGRMRRRMVWRSGQHHAATDADLDRIAALDLASVFDLRSSRERASHPCRRPPEFSAHVVLCADPETRHAPHVAASKGLRGRTVQSTRDSLARNYARIVFRPELQVMIRNWFAMLGEGQGPSLVNCMAGKDRTGIAVALLHAAIGVHPDDILADYLLTNTAGDVEARIASGAATVRAITGPLDEAVLRVLMGVEAAYLESAWAAIDERYGSRDTYLERELGLDAAGRERLRAALSED